MSEEGNLGFKLTGTVGSCENRQVSGAHGVDLGGRNPYKKGKVRFPEEGGAPRFPEDKVSAGIVLAHS